VRRVLIVEDRELNRDLLVQLFEDEYAIDVAADGERAVELALNSRPDLILMDIGLPGLSGLDAVRAIRSQGETVPIIAVSSGVMPGDRERAIDAGCDEFISKPIDDMLLIDMARRLLGGG
jgi:two-component system, cell cycle response regulator DivK